MMSFLHLVPQMTRMQESLMTDLCTITRQGTVFATDVRCRKHKDRLFSEPGDPKDANLRSTQEWGITMPTGTGTMVGDVITFEVVARGDVSIIIGEVLSGDTWQTAERVWGTEPKIATPEVTITIHRYDAILDDWIEVGPLSGNLVYDRNQPTETPVRFSPGGQALYKNGVMIFPLGTDVRVGDRFSLFDLAATFTMVLPGQPQRVEAEFRLDISGDRMG